MAGIFWHWTGFFEIQEGAKIRGKTGSLATVREGDRPARHPRGALAGAGP